MDKHSGTMVRVNSFVKTASQPMLVTLGGGDLVNAGSKQIGHEPRAWRAWAAAPRAPAWAVAPRRTWTGGGAARASAAAAC